MFGVVLWSDIDERKAVIWCEDHGDLAFYNQPDDAGNLALDAGDWVQFDLTMEQHMRYAHNPRLVSEGAYSGLAGALGEAGHSAEPKRSLPVERGSADIIPFSTLARRQGAAVQPTARTHA
ncbi:MAG: hypothetical protein GJ676_03665 [Rhodobacteraceae bacterium]|nr:hypothetical protein [Paracoccaceae bacterium]